MQKRLIVTVLLFGAGLHGCHDGKGSPDVLKAPLPGGGSIEYRALLSYHSGAFAETKKELIWLQPDGTRKVFLVNDTHAGYDEVEIRISNDGKRLWLVDLSNKSPYHFGGALDLSTGEFHREILNVSDKGPPVPWAGRSAGKVLARQKFR